MHFTSERITTIHLGPSVSAKQALIALAMAAYRLAPPLSDEEGAPSDIGLSDAVEHVRDSGIMMLFVKGKAPMFHLDVLGRGATTLTVKVVMSFDDSDDRLFAAASEILDQVFGPVADDEVIDLDESDIIPDGIDFCDADLSFDDIRALAPPVRIAA